jgi:hypothetical protein
VVLLVGIMVICINYTTRDGLMCEPMGPNNCDPAVAWLGGGVSMVLSGYSFVETMWHMAGVRATKKCDDAVDGTSPV